MMMVKVLSALWDKTVALALLAVATSSLYLGQQVSLVNKIDLQPIVNLELQLRALRESAQQISDSTGQIGATTSFAQQIGEIAAVTQQIREIAESEQIAAAAQQIEEIAAAAELIRDIADSSESAARRLVREAGPCALALYRHFLTRPDPAADLPSECRGFENAESGGGAAQGQQSR